MKWLYGVKCFLESNFHFHTYECETKYKQNVKTQDKLLSII